MNTPFGNSITTAEHAIALMFALARQLPEANAQTQAGQWPKSGFMGVELTAKTLGLIGAGNIGSIVASRALGLFAGLEKVGGKDVRGLQAISDFIETAVPEAERERAADVLLRILNGSLFELNAGAREAAGKKALPENDESHRFLSQAVLALSDVSLYPAPVAFELKDFKQVQASVFQVARAPGQNVVYLGCLFLIIGVFAMLYVRERRLWVWLAPEGAGAHARMALSSNRKTMDADKEFEQLQRKLLTPS